MTSNTETVNALRKIAGTANVLADFEDLYVYSFKKIYKEPYFPLMLAVVRAKAAEVIDKAARVANTHGCLLLRRSEIPEQMKASKPIIMLDDSSLPDLKPSRQKKKASTAEAAILGKTQFGTLKHALAQKLLLIDKPALKCEECNVCSSYCTVASSFNGVETWSAKGRMLLIKGMTKEKLHISHKILDVLYTCSNCGLCFAECLQRSELHEAVRAARRQIVLQGAAPEIFKLAAKNILEVGDPSGTPVQKRLSWLRKVSNPSFKDRANVLYWAGCTLSTRTPNTAKAVANILSIANVDVKFLGTDEGCCGYLLLSTGLWDEAIENASKLAEKVRKANVKTMVTSCAGCYYTFVKLFPKILDVEVPCEVLHASEYIENLTKKGEIDLASVDAKATFHDPCSLGRHANVYDAPRNVLKGIPELQFVEMSLNRDNSRCCGGGGGLWSYNNRVSANSALNRMEKDVAPLNVSVLTTACPTCQLNLRNASAKTSTQVKICDFAEIVELSAVKAAACS